MKQTIGQIALVVSDYDEAIQFYTKKLGFELLEDIKMNDTKRWVVVSPAGNEGCKLLLAKAVGDEQQLRVGNQTGGRVFLFLYTDDIERDLLNLNAHNITIIRPLHAEDWGKVLVFADLYGNVWDLIELKK